MAELLENIPRDVRAVSKVIVESDRWHIGMPLAPLAMYWWGCFTDWCTASDSSIFHDYVVQGPLIVFRARTSSFRWMLHPATGEFRDHRNKRVSWAGFLMRNPDVAGDLMLALGTTR
jgi:hypothetical protein